MYGESNERQLCWEIAIMQYSPVVQDTRNFIPTLDGILSLAVYYTIYLCLDCRLPVEFYVKAI